MRCPASKDGARCVLPDGHSSTHKAWPGEPRVAAVDLPRVPTNLLHDLSFRLNEIDRQLEAEVQGMLELAMTTGLRRAGARVVSKTKSKQARAAAASAPPDQRAQAILACGVQLAALGLSVRALLRGVFEEVAERVLKALAKGHDRTLLAIAEELSDKLGLDLSVDDLKAGVEAVADEQRRRAVEAMLDRMEWFAEQRLTDPSGAPVEGEFDVDEVVPFGVARDTLSIAGGVQPNGTTGELARTASGHALDFRGEATEAPSGLAGGPINLRVLESAVGPLDAVRIAWRWNHSARPFDPHQNLNGIVYTEEQAKLRLKADPEKFPYVAEYFPGDHVGCRCTEEFTVELLDRGERPIDVALEGSTLETPLVEEFRSRGPGST